MRDPASAAFWFSRRDCSTLAVQHRREGGRLNGGSRGPLRQQFASFFGAMTGRLKAAVALVGAVGTVVCTLTAVGVIGGGSGGSTAVGGASHVTAMTAADWARRANVICVRTNDTRSALPTLKGSKMEFTLRSGCIRG